MTDSGEDVVARLRDMAGSPVSHRPITAGRLCEEAAREIMRLRAALSAAVDARTPAPAVERMAEALRRLESDHMAEAADALNTIHHTLRHRQQPQDATFHRGEKALRDGQNIARAALADYDAGRLQP